MGEARAVSRQERLIGGLRTRLHYLAEPARGPPHLRPAGPQLARTAGPRGHAPPGGRARAADAALLPRRQGREADEHDPAAEPARAAVPGGNRSHPDRRGVPGASTSSSTSRQTDLFARRPPPPCSTRSWRCSSDPALKGLSARTLRALWTNRHRIDAKFRRDPANRARFLQMFREPRDTSPHALRRMNSVPASYGHWMRCSTQFGSGSSARCSCLTSSTSTHTVDEHDPHGDPQPAPVHPSPSTRTNTRCARGSSPTS